MTCPKPGPAQLSAWVDALAATVPDVRHPGTARALASLMAFVVDLEQEAVLTYDDPEAIFNDF